MFGPFNFQRYFLKTLVLVGISLFITIPSLANDNDQQAPLLMSTEEDHQRSLHALKISSLRPGANGNDTEAVNAANYDESKANPYRTLPAPLLLNNRQQVVSEQQWWEQRRPEILEVFDREVYGRVPEQVFDIHWQVNSKSNIMVGGIPAIRKELIGIVDNSHYPSISVAIKSILILPENINNKTVPVIVQLSGGFFLDMSEERSDNSESWQSQTLKKGWAYAYLDTSSIQADNGAGLTTGIIGLANQGQPRAMDDWGVLRAWAWGASQLLNYFESNASIDASKVAIQGHSRWGKAALVAMAYDQRFALAYISSSGAAGAKLHRRNWGELVENVAGSGEYHWMAGNYIKYAGPLNWSDLPVDAHQLIALCAPRPVFISSGNEGDLWVDAKGMFMAASAAQPVYHLLNATGMGTEQFPELEYGLMDGEIAFRQHAGGHTDGPNWPIFLTYAKRYLD